MHRRRVLPAAVSLTAAAALLLTGCGGGGEKSDGDKIAGTGDAASQSASPTPSPSAAAPSVKGPDMAFPADVKITFPAADVTDPAQVAAARDAANFIRSFHYGIVKQDPDDAAYKFYSEYLSPAFKYAKGQIKADVDDGYTISGELRFSRTKVAMAGNKATAVVSFCSDASKFYSKQVKTGKVDVTTPSVRDYTSWQILMAPSKSAKGLWKARQTQVRDGVEECRS
ncbi:hypothetical protein [Streptomyces sp. NPDC001020]